jgi:hypothetical protein
LLVAVLLPLPAAAQTLTRGPYLQLLTRTSITVVWNTDAPSTCRLQVGPAGGAATMIDGTIASRCVITAAGLTAGAEYAYVPYAGNLPLTSESIFRTDHPTEPFTMLVFGDSGDASANQMAVRDRMLITPADLMLHTGDMIYESGEAANYDPRFFVPYAQLIRRLVLWPCVGNHDVITAGGAPWRDAFFTPANNTAGSEHYYSFDAGNAHVAVLDSTASLAPGSAQYLFLDADLAASTAPWKFVAFHHPPYSSSASTMSIRTNLVPLLDRHRVAVVFNGHEHNYERTRPLRGGQVVPAGEGTVYVVTGGGGRSSLDAAVTSSFTAYAESAHHFTRVLMDGDTLQLEMVRVDGVIRDVMTLRAPRVVPVAADTYVSSGSANLNFGSSALMAADASPTDIAYLRFVVSGIGATPVTRAVLRVQVDGGSSANSNSGGRVRRISNGAWQENAVTYATRPALDGPVLATQGTVALNQIVDFDVTSAVSGDGTYDFAVDSTSTDGVRYRTREATNGWPILILTLGSPPTTTTSSTTSSTSVSTTLMSSSTTSSSTTTSSTSSTTTTSTSSTSSTTPSSTTSSSTSTSRTSTSSSTTTTTTVATVTTTSSSTTSTSSTSSTTSPASTPGLVAAYGFSEGSGSLIGDRSGNGNAGSTTGTAWTTAGRFGSALVFNGTTSWVTVPHSAALNLSTALTIEAWVYPTVAPAGWRTVVAKERPSGVVYYLHAGSSSPSPATGLVVATGEQTLYGVAQLPANTWTHLAATYDGAAQRLYVNGVQVSTRAQTGQISTSTSPLRLGGNASYGEYFQGRIDEVRLYNRALTAAQIQADMNAPVGP